jgi:hypothetical protein
MAIMTATNEAKKIPLSIFKAYPPSFISIPELIENRRKKRNNSRRALYKNNQFLCSREKLPLLSFQRGCLVLLSMKLFMLPEYDYFLSEEHFTKTNQFLCSKKSFFRSLSVKSISPC